MKSINNHGKPLSGRSAFTDAKRVAGRRMLFASRQTTISRLCAAGLFLVLSTLPALASLLIYEPFDYPAGSPITGQTNNYSPLSPVWAQAGFATPPVHQAAAPGLTSPPGFPADATSFANAGDMKGNDNNEYARISLGTQFNTSTNVYYSLLLNVPTTEGLLTTNSNANANNGVIIAFNNNVGDQPKHPTVWAGALTIRQGVDWVANGTFQLGVRAGTTPGGATYWSSDLSTNQTYFVVVRYSSAATAGDYLSASNYIWIDPSSATYGADEGSVPSPDGSTVGSMNKSPTSDHVASLIIGAGISGNATIHNPTNTLIDEIRVGTSWADVTSNTVGLVIVKQPKDQRLIVGGLAEFEAAGFLANKSQWQYSNTVTHTVMDIPGATNNTLLLSNVQLADAGAYRLVATYTVSGNSVTSNPAFLYVYPDIYPRLAPIWQIAPFERPYMDTYTTQLPMERYFAFNSLSNQVLIVSRTNTVTLDSNAHVYVLNGKSGADLYEMNADSTLLNLYPGNSGITLNTIDVADDGAVYGANISDSSFVWTVYRWADSGSAAAPAVVWSGDPWGGGVVDRFGDSLAVRGAGSGTEILADSSNGSYGTLLADPTSIATTYPEPFTNSVVGGVTGGRTLVWGQTNTFWEHHRQGGLVLASYDLGGFTSTIMTNFNNFPSTMGVCGFNFDLNLLCGINFLDNTNAPDTLALFDISDPSQPVFITSYDFPVNSRPNANRVGRVMFVGDRVYALDGNNGFIAMAVVPKLNISYSAGSAVLSWKTNYTDYVLQAGTDVVSGTWTNVTPATIVGQNYQVTKPVTGTKLFYRLKFE